MSTEADIDALIERLDSHMGQQAATVLLADCRLARDALKQLRAERDAAARDMRERCKAVVMYRAAVWKNAVEADMHSPCGQALWEECEDIANHIGAFPLLATEETSRD